MALLNLGDDPWLLEYESCEKLQRDIMEQLIVREKEARMTEAYSRLSANIRLRLKQYNNEVNQLKDKLNHVSKKRSVTYEETERRTRQVELLKSKSVQMQRMFDEVSNTSSRDRASLLGTSDWESRDDKLLDGESSHSVDDFQAHKQRMLEDQEKGLDNLSKIIARQKSIAQTITTEVDLHNDIIEDLGTHIDRTDGRLSNETRNIVVVDKKDKTCIYWVFIILLFLSIIIIEVI